ncbi:MAG: PEGA domain-containing protein [Byssovorax sp.]
MMQSAYRAALAAMVIGIGILGCGSSEVKPPEVPLAAAAPEEPTATDDSGQLEILCNPPTPVLVDGKKAGTTPINGYRVPPGSHDVTFVDELTGNRTMTITLGPGEGRAVVSDRPPSASTTVEPPEKKPAEKKPGKGGGK